MDSGGLPQFLPHNQLEGLLHALQSSGYSTIAPKVEDGAILYRAVDSIHDLPRGLSDQQSAGSYRLRDRDSHLFFGWANGPTALKPLLFPPHENLWSATRTAEGRIEFSPSLPAVAPLAVLGVRGCDLAAVERMDRHFLRPDGEDPWYRERRENLLLIAVDCTHPSDNCFCASTGSGPEAGGGYDLRLHELGEGFLINAGTLQGEEIMEKLTLSPPPPKLVERSREALAQAGAVQRQGIAAADFRPLFTGQEESPQWERVAERCLGCGNCTAVCPTCFCHREEEVPSLELEHSVHQRAWDSCFTAEHSMIHGRPVRAGIRERYRQWLTHKLAGWHDQFGESGCVGCGRCITWCPVGINLVEESSTFSSSVEGG